ncbi:MAG: adenine phosphoribosyltransferase [Akkermansiaceae bacterium]
MNKPNTQACDKAITLKKHIRDVPDFPIPGITFKDITPILANVELLQLSIDALIATADNYKIDKVVALDARGFIFATPVALALKAGFIPVRKKGKLPWKTLSTAYSLEYGENTLEIHQDAVSAGENILLIDDLLATGGSASAAIKLLRELGANIVAASFLIELNELKGRDLLGDIPVHAIIQY